MIIVFVLWLSHSLSSAANLCATPRPSLIKYHTRLLTLTGDGGGGWTLSRIGTAEERMGIDREIATLEDKLAEVEDWEKRVDELNGLLSIQDTDDAEAT